MTRSELILTLSKRFPQLTHSDIVLSVQIILDGMGDHLTNSGRIELRGFGSFVVSNRAARMSRNPRTGEKVNVPAKNVPHFKPSIDLKRRVNGNR